MAISKIENCSDLLSLVTYVDKLKSIIKKDFKLSFEEFAVLTYINENVQDEEYHLKNIINKLNYKQPQIVKAVKNLSQQDFFTKRRNEYDERTVLIFVDKKQRKTISELLEKIDSEIAKTQIEA